MSDKKNPDLQGEGNYEAGKRYQKEQHEFAQSDKVEEGARQAAEDVASEEKGAELEHARQESAKGRTVKK